MISEYIFFVDVVLIYANGVNAGTLNWRCRGARKTIRFHESDTAQATRELKTRRQGLRVLGKASERTLCLEQCCERNWCKHVILVKGICYGSRLPYGEIRRQGLDSKYGFKGFKEQRLNSTSKYALK